MKTFLIVITALLSLSLGDIHDNIEDLPYDEAITMNCPDECPLLYQPICAGGNNFANQCELDCENRHRRETLLPELYPSCHRTCAKCRTQLRKTKRQRHSLAKHFRRLQKKALTTAIEAKATLQQQSLFKWICLECATEHNRQKVCADNRETFGSLCLLNCENKRRQERGSVQLNVICSKACSECATSQENKSVVPRIKE